MPSTVWTILRVGVLVAIVGAMGCKDDGEGRRIGESCTSDEMCETNWCDELQCKPRVPEQPQAECSHDLECESEICSSGRCADHGTRELGDPCTQDLQCASEACAGGVCVMLCDGGISD